MKKLLRLLLTGAILLLVAAPAVSQIKTSEVEILSTTNTIIENGLQLNQNVGVGVAPSTTQAVRIKWPSFSVESNSTKYLIGVHSELRDTYKIPSGVYDDGYRMGLNVALHVTDPAFVGGLDEQTGIRIQYGTNAAGITGTIDRAVGLLINGLDQSPSAITNKYGVYQTGTNFINYFQGKVGIGQISTPSSEKLEVAGNIKSSGDLIAGGGVTASGNITSSSTVVGTAVQSNGALYFAGNSKLVRLLTTNNGTTPVTSDIVIESSVSNFWAQITITGNETNLHNHNFLWHGVLTWDTAYDQVSLIPISTDNISAVAVDEGGQIILRITNTLGSSHYPWVKGSAIIVK